MGFLPCFYSRYFDLLMTPFVSWAVFLILHYTPLGKTGYLNLDGQRATTDANAGEILATSC